MSSSDLRGDAIAGFTEHRSLILGIVGAAVVLVLLFAILGGRLLGGVLFVGYSLLWVAVVAFVLYLFYRLVVAVERIADAQERIASALFQAELDGELPGESTDTVGSDGDGAPDDDPTPES